MNMYYKVDNCRLSESFDRMCIRLPNGVPPQDGMSQIRWPAARFNRHFAVYYLNRALLCEPRVHMLSAAGQHRWRQHNQPALI